jgi:formate/nitrite transporter FocA (FNT family)
LIFALLAIKTGALRTEYADRLVQLGVDNTQRGSGQLFWAGVMGGWLIALVAWTVTAGRESIGELSITWLLTFVVGIAHFAHCIAGSGEVLSAVVHGSLPWHEYLRWISFTTVGNILGGVFLVSLLNYGQVHADA